MSIFRTRHKNYKEEMARTKEENRWKSPESLTHDGSQKKGRGRFPVPESFPWNYSHRRVAEQAFLEDVNGLKPGSEWDRVAKNCDFNSKVISKDHNVDVEVHFRFSSRIQSFSWMPRWPQISITYIQGQSQQEGPVENEVSKTVLYVATSKLLFSALLGGHISICLFASYY